MQHFKQKSIIADKQSRVLEGLLEIVIKGGFIQTVQKSLRKSNILIFNGFLDFMRVLMRLSQLSFRFYPETI